ncbi:MAG: transposase, partial [Wolbachia sp.]
MRKKYPTDLSEKEWARIEKYFRVSYKKGGRPSKYSKREILNAILYILRTGCQWRYLPHDFPPWKGVHEQFIPSFIGNGTNEKELFLAIIGKLSK